MENICLIIDFDGFQCKKRLLVKEFGYCEVSVKNTSKLPPPQSILYNISDIRLDQKDLRTAKYCINKIHGLEFYSNDPKHWTEFFYDLKKIYDCFKIGEKNIVAYKGGIHEKAVLDLLGIPNINLESYGCPKYDDLISVEDESFNCGNHRNIQKVHCPKSEVNAFRKWLYNSS